MSSKHLSLALQLAQLDQPAPVDFDPEDAGVIGVEAGDASEERGIDPAGREHYLDVGQSALRKLCDNVTDPKYEGIRVSRKQLLEESDGEASENVPGDGDRPVTSEEEDDPGEAAEKEEIDEDEVGSDSEAQVRRNDPAVPASRSLPQTDDDLSSTLKRTREEERKKGKAVARQLAMYDSLLDARIRLQKCVSSMNKLPGVEKIPDYLIDEASRQAANKLLIETTSLADDLFQLQEKLVDSNELPIVLSRKRRRVEDVTALDRDWEEELQECTAHSSELESSFHPHLLTTLQKWSNKVLAIAPAALLPSNHTKFSRSNTSQVKSAVQLVDEALLDREKLVARTRVWRGKGARLDSISEAMTDSVPRANEDKSKEIAETDLFDDTDFYQALLRDVIDARSGSGTGAGFDGMSADWRSAQKARKVRKGAVDTRASKGRKLRYEVHEKLQHFMAPVAAPAGATSWHEAQIDELFASLLGRGFVDKDAHVEVAAEDPAPMDIDVEHALKSGFRVFG